MKPNDVTIKVCKQFYIHSFEPLRDVKLFLKEVAIDKTVFCSIRRETKTRLSFSFFLGASHHSINRAYPETGNKYHDGKRWSVWDGERQLVSYLVTRKGKVWDDIQKQIKATVCDVWGVLPDESFQVFLELDRNVMEFIPAGTQVHEIESYQFKGRPEAELIEG